MNNFEIKSSLGSAYRAALNELLFFNPAQTRVHRGILSAIRRFGLPVITDAGDGSLRVGVASGAEVQSLFAVSTGETARLLAAIIFCRDEPHVLTVLQMAALPSRTMSAAGVSGSVMLAMIEELKRIGRQVKGITHIRLLYAHENCMDLPVGIG